MFVCLKLDSSPPPPVLFGAASGTEIAHFTLMNEKTTLFLCITAPYDMSLLVIALALLIISIRTNNAC